MLLVVALVFLVGGVKLQILDQHVHPVIIFIVESMMVIAEVS